MSAFAHLVSQHAQFIAQVADAPSTRVDARRRPPPPLTGELAAATLQCIKDHPNQDVREIASLLNVEPPSLYDILQRLKRRGEIVGIPRFGSSNIWKAVASC
jgi:hypothetical protein